MNNGIQVNNLIPYFNGAKEVNELLLLCMVMKRHDFMGKTKPVNPYFTRNWNTLMSETMGKPGATCFTYSINANGDGDFKVTGEINF